jgi:hypothetical protein
MIALMVLSTRSSANKILLKPDVCNELLRINFVAAYEV